jgi:protein subunit release factor B
MGFISVELASEWIPSKPACSGWNQEKIEVLVAGSNYHRLPNVCERQKVGLQVVSPNAGRNKEARSSKGQIIGPNALPCVIKWFGLLRLIRKLWVRSRSSRP